MQYSWKAGDFPLIILIAKRFFSSECGCLLLSVKCPVLHTVLHVLRSQVFLPAQSQLISKKSLIQPFKLFPLEQPLFHLRLFLQSFAGKTSVQRITAAFQIKITSTCLTVSKNANFHPSDFKQADLTTPPIELFIIFNLEKLKLLE